MIKNLSKKLRTHFTCGGSPTTNKRWGAVFVGPFAYAKHTKFAGPGGGVENFLTQVGHML